jgi:molybdopterin-guanine dinucleotide biosynthesis protein A
MPPTSLDVEAFILAGGRSRRMGRDKARLNWDGEPLVRRLAARIAPAVARVRLVAKPDSDLADLGLEMLYDAAPEPALVHGIRAALMAPGLAWRWLLGCDMPGVDAAVLGALQPAAVAARAPGAAPWLPGCDAPEPLPSLWHRDVGAAVTPAWGFAARDWVQRARLAVWHVEPQTAAALANLNTPEDWDAWRRRAPRPEAE